MLHIVHNFFFGVGVDVIVNIRHQHAEKRHFIEFSENIAALSLVCLHEETDQVWSTYLTKKSELNIQFKPTLNF